ncbi:uncharacterized protein LOC135955596 [Calliphora vicina]|uniref:uncharacterized protein LOC135955596 n=1 Tax=Calliphora vicina TaxID=7373 RepID=UPI00325C1AF1
MEEQEEVPAEVEVQGNNLITKNEAALEKTVDEAVNNILLLIDNSNCINDNNNEFYIPNNQLGYYLNISNEVEEFNNDDEGDQIILSYKDHFWHDHEGDQIILDSCISYIHGKKSHKHEGLRIAEAEIIRPSTSAAARKRSINLEPSSLIPTKHQRLERFIVCEDCNVEVQQEKCFTHCTAKDHKINTEKSIQNRVVLLKSAFRSRLSTYHFPKGDTNLNVDGFLEEGYQFFKKLINNSLADHIIIKFNLELTAVYKLPAHPLKPETDMYHITEMMRLSRADDIDDTLKYQIDSIKAKMSEFQERDSGWTLIKIKWLDININKASPLNGSSYIPTPVELVKKKACINIINNDIFCFKWCIIAALYNGNSINTIRTSTYKINNISDNIIILRCGRVLNFSTMNFPADIKEIKLFEKNNIDISINVFGYDKKLKSVVGPYYITTNEKIIHINLMLLESEDMETYHYILIKNISR